jgi:succinyl-CoA synthetase alpha subunit
LALFEADEQTKSIIMVGEIGGCAEEEAAEYIQSNVSKPVFISKHLARFRPWLQGLAK